MRTNETGYLTSAGILIAARVANNYDPRAVGVIAVAPRHPDCNLVSAPDTGTSVTHYPDESNC